MCVKIHLHRYGGLCIAHLEQTVPKIKEGKYLDLLLQWRIRIPHSHNLTLAVTSIKCNVSKNLFAKLTFSFCL